MKKVLAAVLSALLLLSLCACGARSANEPASFFDEFPTGDEINTVEIEQNPTAEITLEDGSVIALELYYYTAPNAVADFIAMSEAGVYDSMEFNEVRRDCMVMLGSADGEYSAPYYIKDELNEKGSENALSHTAGVVSMLKTASSDTCTGQFFILTEDQTWLDNKWTAFAKVTSGMDVVEKIAASKCDDDNMLLNPYAIKSVTVETYGVDFPNPTIIPKNQYSGTIIY